MHDKPSSFILLSINTNNMKSVAHMKIMIMAGDT